MKKFTAWLFLLTIHPLDLQAASVRSTVHTGVDMAFGARPGEALRHAASSTVTNAVGGHVAGRIGQLRSERLNTLAHKTLHALNGAGTATMGALITGEDVGRAALSGATGSVLTATFMDILNDGVIENATEEHLRGPNGTTPAARQRFLSDIETTGRLNAQIVGIGSVLAAGLLNLDPSIAQQMSSLTSHNNCVPFMMVTAEQVGQAAQTGEFMSSASWDELSPYAQAGLAVVAGAPALIPLGVSGAALGLVNVGRTGVTALGQHIRSLGLIRVPLFINNPYAEATALISSIGGHQAYNRDGWNGVGEMGLMYGAGLVTGYGAGVAIGAAAPYVRQALQSTLLHLERPILARLHKAQDITSRLNQAPYNPRAVQAMVEARYGAGSVRSHTIADLSAPNARLGLRGQAHPQTGVPFDQRGFPIFDRHVVFETRLPAEVARMERRLPHMKEATLHLKRSIEAGQVDAHHFSQMQLDAILNVKEKIPGLTWHHHQEFGRMQLIPEAIHTTTAHAGGIAQWTK